MFFCIVITLKKKILHHYYGQLFIKPIKLSTILLHVVI